MVDIQGLIDKNNRIDIDNIVDTLIHNLANELIGNNEKMLVDLVFSSMPTQKDVSEFFEHWDIEAEGGTKSLILSYFMKLHPELEFSQYVAPRLKGLLNFYKFQNMKLISHFTKICNALKIENIDVAIIKGGAMKHLRPEFSRIMSDIDVVVREKDWEKTIEIVEKLGYDYDDNGHSIDLHPKDSKEGLLDIHKYIDMETGFETAFNEGLFDRARKEKVFTVEELVPSNEDLVFISLVNMAKNLVNKTSWNGILFTLFDVKFLIETKKDFDWNIIIDNTVKTQSKLQVCFAVKFINQLVPDFLPEKIKQNILFEKESNDYFILLMYRRFLLLDMKRRGHELKFSSIFKNKKNFVEYFSLKPKYLLLKQSIFSKNPNMAKLVLKLDEKFHIGEWKC